ncbi:helix-turn-helix domain-containing protein [Pseudoxanthomonas winnipegensis]|uniref:Cytoskeleton protein RodZ n=2 Tax=Pseudoxanthomonas winnipegensis TaxID=2480810 RepID=A0AAW8GDQ8_9GAMM|nr:cytoskeleton protein RodZ [Pseudoxanthomonas winnipegensis]MDQ1132370.1 cytoskeleton protein RodZ [Pseudoxanthomonas winnipegensis]MDR6137619.1 cytoskeleton protein RodZ [Pseudoxanthomonas sp. SORGH_AS_0997]
MMDRNTTQPASGEAQQAQIAALLRQAREQQGMTVAQAGTRLKVPARVVEILESGHWEALGAPVFVRGHVRSYARALGVDIGAYLDQSLLQAVRPVELVSRTHTPRYQRVLESTARRAVYVVITVCFFAVPFWLVVSNNSGKPALKTASLDEVPKAMAPLAPSNVTAAAPVAAPAPAPQVEPDNAPITASMAPRLTRETPPAAAALTLTFSGDSWVDVQGPDGQSLERGLLKAGQTRSFQAGQVARVKLGNANAVQVQRAGSTVDLTPYQRANVARFAVSSDGSLAPVQD